MTAKIMSKTVLVLQLLASFLPCSALCQDVLLPGLETYATASQVERLFSTAEGRQNALRVFRELGIGKVYLEGLRSGHSPDRRLLIETRDYFLRKGMKVSGGITTTAGKDFGVRSTHTRLFLNYQSEKTQRDMAAQVRAIAAIFDEIMVDDFLATDDQSTIAKEAKGSRSWSAYRLDLMSDFAERFLIRPARNVNPDVRLTIKYPQWYDRFHRFGYDVVREPKLFDRIWVGTETRDPHTPKYGYVVPTQGYINYRWLCSIAKGKTGGAWFDFHDCPANLYLMQAYQSVLAGAEKLILFDTASVLKQGAAVETLMNRRDALFALGNLLHRRKPLGMSAYKPPHSEGSDAAGGANLYVYDYIATLGLAPIPTAEPLHLPPAGFLSRHAVADSRMAEHLRRWGAFRTL